MKIPFPTEWKLIKFMFQTTNQSLLLYKSPFSHGFPIDFVPHTVWGRCNSLDHISPWHLSRATQRQAQNLDVTSKIPWWSIDFYHDSLEVSLQKGQKGLNRTFECSLSLFSWVLTCFDMFWHVLTCFDFSIAFEGNYFLGCKWQYIYIYNVNPGLINHGLLVRGYSSNSHFIQYFFMVPSQLNSRLGFIHPGLTLYVTLAGWQSAPMVTWLRRMESDGIPCSTIGVGTCQN